MNKVGILGGSFDPIHMGHIRIAQNAYEEFSLDEVWFVPAGHSPNKDEHKMTPAKDRFRMVELALSDYPQFCLSDIETESEQTSYTYLTLTRLKKRYPNVTFYFIMGADSLDYFEQWFHPEIICQNAILLVAVRDKLDLKAIREKIASVRALFSAEIYPLSGERMDISSTELRTCAKLQDLECTEGMLPQKVAEYIAKRGLYGYGTQGDSKKTEKKAGQRTV